MGQASYARRLVDEAIRRGYYLSVHDGEEWPVKVSRDREAIIRAMESVDICRVRIRGNVCGPCRACWDVTVRNVSYPRH